MARNPIVAKIVFNDLPKLQGQMRQRAGQVIRKTALDVEANAKALVPVDTGNLKGSLQAEKEQEFSWIVGTDVEYAVYVEFGTGARGAASNIQRPADVHYKQGWAGMPAQPFLIPAAEAVRPSFEAAMKELLD